MKLDILYIQEKGNIISFVKKRKGKILDKKKKQKKNLPIQFSI